MATFAQSFKASVSADGKTVTITDLSNWTESSLLRANFVRAFLLTDANGQTLITITLPVDSDVATYSLTKDMWINFLFTITGASNYSLLLRYYFDRILGDKFQEALMEYATSCGCADQEALNIDKSCSFWFGAIQIAPVANSTGVQVDLDAANAFIDLV